MIESLYYPCTGYRRTQGCQCRLLQKFSSFHDVILFLGSSFSLPKTGWRQGKYLGRDFLKIFSTVRGLPRGQNYRISAVRASDSAYFFREPLSDPSDDAYPSGLLLSEPRTVLILPDWRCRRYWLQMLIYLSPELRPPKSGTEIGSCPGSSFIGSVSLKQPLRILPQYILTVRSQFLI